MLPVLLYEGKGGRKGEGKVHMLLISMLLYEGKGGRRGEGKVLL